MPVVYFNNFNKREGEVELFRISKTEKLVGVDLEGVNVGRRNGRVTLVQIATRTAVNLFDIQESPEFIPLIKGIFEDKEICKVVHDVRGDRTTLQDQFSIQLINVFDTQIAFRFTYHWRSQFHLKSGYEMSRLGLNKVCEKLGITGNPHKEKFVNIFRENPTIYAQRPLTQEMIDYAAADTDKLLQFYDRMKPIIDNYVPEKARPDCRWYSKEIFREFCETSRTGPSHAPPPFFKVYDDDFWK